MRETKNFLDTSSHGQGEPATPTPITPIHRTLEEGGPPPAKGLERGPSGLRSTNGRSQSGPPPASTIVFVGDACIDLETWELSRQGNRSRLQEKPFRVLLALIDRPGELVSRSELSERLWPDGTIVEFDNNLNSAVASLRTALGDTARAPRVIETLPRLGYRLIAELRREDPAELESGAFQATPGSNGARYKGNGLRWLAVTIGVALVLATAGVRQVLKDPLTQPVDAAISSSNGEMDLPRDPAGRQAWQTGLYLLDRGAVGDLTLALESFEETRRLEPLFAPAHEEAAETLLRMSFMGGLDLRQGLTQAREAARQAQRLDRNSATPFRIEALARLHLEWDFEGASADLESALRLGPADAENYLAAATFLAAAGNAEAAVAAARRAVELDPASSLLKADLSYFLIAASQFLEALAVSDELLELEPDSRILLGSSQLSAERLGLYERSLAAAQRIMELRGASPADIRTLSGVKAQVGLIRFRTWRLENLRANDSPSFFYLALRQVALHKNDLALESLRQAYEEREPWMVYLHSYPQFDALETAPRFTAFLQELGFPGPTDAIVTRIESLL